jgi:16S rRNA processing protein RimM
LTAAERIEAGRVGRPHGLDGSFYVTRARARLLQEGMSIWLDDRPARIVRRAGVDQRPIVRLEGVGDRAAAEALRGGLLTVEHAQAPPLGENEWWADDLEGCVVMDRGRRVGMVRSLLELPSCEALEVEVEGATRLLLVPMVRAAIRRVDLATRTIDVDMSFVGEE